MLIPTIFSSHKDYHIVNKDTLKNMILVTENTRNSHLEVFYKKSVLGNFTKFTGKQLCQRLFFNKVAGLRPPCFLMNFVKFPRTPFFTEHLKHEESHLCSLQFFNTVLITFVSLSLRHIFSIVVGSLSLSI